jgi:hypothetical protein
LGLVGGRGLSGKELQGRRWGSKNRYALADNDAEGFAAPVEHPRQHDLVTLSAQVEGAGRRVGRGPARVGAMQLTPKHPTCVPET